MPKNAATSLSPIGFLQTFVAQSLRTAGQMGCAECETGIGYVESIGLTAGPCFERICREQLGLKGDVDLDQYADIILRIKNQIGGNFSRASSAPGVIRVVNSRCPFGDRVQEAPELCRMTSSVFGGIAARNFGYAKVDHHRHLGRVLAQPGEDHVQAGRTRGLGAQLGRGHAGAAGGRRRADDHRIAGLQGDQDLEDRGRRRVGDRHERQNGSHRLGHLDDAVAVLVGDHADGALVLDVVVDQLRGDEVLDHLVLPHAQTGLLGGHAGKLDASVEGAQVHRAHDGVGLRLVEAAELGGLPVFNAPFSNTRSVAELVLAQIVFLLSGIPSKNAAARMSE